MEEGMTGEAALESWPLKNKGAFLYGSWRKLDFYWSMQWTTQGLILNSGVTWSGLWLRTVTPATVWIGSNMRSKKITQEVIKAIPRRNEERLNWIRERRIWIWVIKLEKMGELDNWWVREGSSLASWCLAWATWLMVVPFIKMCNMEEVGYGGLRR